MSDRLERILNLSKKTGDTVIVHDPSADHDLVVLPFQTYETLVSVEHAGTQGYEEYLLEDMSERELIDKINRDIAIWRSYQELNERDRQAHILEDQLVETPLEDPFEEDFTHHSDWHRVSELVDERFKKVEDRSVDNEEDGEDPIHTYTPISEPVSTVQEHSKSFHDDSLIPLKQETSDSVFEDEEELPPGEDPVFFEEPVT